MALIRKPTQLAPALSPPPAGAKPGSDIFSRTMGGGAGLVTGLTPAELEWKRKIFEQVVRGMDLSLLQNLDNNEARRQIHEVCERFMAMEVSATPQTTRLRIIRDIQDEILGLGPLEALFRDPSITDILVNGPKKVYIERRGKLEQAPVFFDNDRHLMTIIERIVSRVGRRIDESSPMVDARLPDGSRVNAIIPPWPSMAPPCPSVASRRNA